MVVQIIKVLWIIQIQPAYIHIIIANKKEGDYNMKEFIKDGDFIYVNAPYMEAYIPKDLFSKDGEKESAIAYEYGEGYRLIGEFMVRVFNNPVDNYSDEELYNLRQKTKLRTFIYPNMITTFPSDTEELELTISANPDSTMEKYVVFKYEKGDIMMESRIRKDISNCEKYFDILCKGKIPESIPYADQIELMEKNYAINDLGFGVPAATREAIIASLCRAKEDPKIPFRMIAGKGDSYDPNGYIMLNMRQVTAYTNVMTSLTFEDVGSMLASSINISRSGKKQTETPFEKILSQCKFFKIHIVCKFTKLFQNTPLVASFCHLCAVIFTLPRPAGNSTLPTRPTIRPKRYPLGPYSRCFWAANGHFSGRIPTPRGPRARREKPRMAVHEPYGAYERADVLSLLVGIID